MAPMTPTKMQSCMEPQRIEIAGLLATKLEPKRIEIDCLSARSTEPDSDKSQDGSSDQDMFSPPGFRRQDGASRTSSFGSDAFGSGEWTPPTRPRSSGSFDSTGAGPSRELTPAISSFAPLRAPPGLDLERHGVGQVSAMAKQSDRKVAVSLDSLVSKHHQGSRTTAQIPTTPMWLIPGASARKSAPLPQCAQVCKLPQGPQVSATDLNAKADKLELLASQLMAQAYQAKAASNWMRTAPSPNVAKAAVRPSPTGCNAVASLPPGLESQELDLNASVGAPASLSKADVSTFTTVMLRNLPNKYTRAMLMEFLDQNGFVKCYDFIYMPVDFKRNASFGYAFVNMVTHADAERSFSVFHGFSNWTICSSSKVLQVAWGEPLQGLESHLARYRNSPVMHEDVREEFKPVLLKDGVQLEFPPPTRKIRKPHVKVAHGFGADDTNRL